MDNIEKELKLALQYIEPYWRMQNNYQDYKSNFIYDVKTFEEVITLSSEYGVLMLNMQFIDGTIFIPL